jgi:hypothetical protein
MASQSPHPDQSSGLPATGLALTISLAGFGADPRPARRESSSDVGPRSLRPRRLVNLKHRIVASARLTKSFWRADETVSWDSESVVKPTWPIKDPDQQRGSIMWAFIIGLVYGRSCAKYLADLARHRHSWI